MQGKDASVNDEGKRVGQQEKDEKEVILGNYKVLLRIGTGRMASVYKAMDLTTSRLVALKVLSSNLAKYSAFVEQFFTESRSVARINHPNVIHIVSAGEQERKHLFFVMEYAEGGTLAQVVKKLGTIPVGQAVDYILQAARGLRAAYQIGIVHRDVKPSNLLLTSDGTVKVADFGLAQMVMGEKFDLLDRPPSGTPAYVAPEQAAFDAVDHRSDIYSLGATFFHLVTGRQPFEAETKKEVVRMHATEQVPSPRSLNPHVPKCVCDVILKMMAKWMIERYQTHEELIADLERVQRELARRRLSDEERSRFALLGRRVAAFALDNVLILLAALALVFAPRGHEAVWGPDELRATWAIALVALTAYGTFMLTFYGRTLGMMWMGLRIADARGSPPWWGVALGRCLAVNVFYLFLVFPRNILAAALLLVWLVGLAAALFRKDGQPLHDFLCGTRVAMTEGAGERR